MADTLKKFGKFFLLDLLAQGGMAEIYRARHATPTGGGRLLAIKRIQQSYSSNPEFINMFRGETKVTSGFTHPNIVQVYDYGEEQDQLYIAMEYVDGRNLRQFISRLGEMKALFPIEVSCYIMEQAAQALQYAHEYKDKFSGKSLNIIHRDVSPQNILVSYDGAIKVIDFGIAKAETQSESTRAGVIKGKPSYLSPEQIAGEVLDGRSDVFALGVVFWELLVGKKLFSGDNDLAVIRMVENAHNHVKPPSLFNPKVPKELDAILLKALEKDRNRRYQSAGELQRAIHKFLYQFAGDFNPTDLSFYAKDLFKNEILEDRKKLLKLNEKAEQLLSSAVEHNEASSVNSSVSPPPPHEQTEVSIKRESLVEAQQQPVAPPPAIEVPAEEPKVIPKVAAKPEKKIVRLDKKDEKTAGALVLEDSPKRSSASRSSQARRPGASRTNTNLTRTQASQTETSSLGSWLKIAAALALAVGGGAYYLNDTGQLNSLLGRNKLVVQSGQTETNRTSSHGEGATPTDVQRKVGSVPSAQTEPNNNFGVASIILHLKINPPGGNALVKINGSPVDAGPSGFTVPLDQSLALEIERPGFQNYRKSLFFESSKVSGLRDWPMDVELIPSRFGFLSINTTPSAEAVIFIEGGEEHVQTPFSNKRLPVGTYRIRLENKLLQMSRELSVSIEENRVKKLDERLSVISDSNNN